MTPPPHAPRRVAAKLEVIDESEAAFADRDAEPDEAPVAPPRRWRTCRDVVDYIDAHKNDPWLSLKLGADEIVSVAPGGIILLAARTKVGKSSFAACALLKHALDAGPALSVSLELPAHEWVARAIGSRRDAAWADVLRGAISRDDMLSALPERLAIIDREDATMSAVERAIDDLRAAYPGQPVLVAVDYAQLVELQGDDEIRIRVGRVMRALDRVARTKLVAMLVLSQSSRAASRALAAGERIGVDSVDAGAESADLERWASAVITIGQLAEPADDGSRAVELSIAAARMQAGDRVLPARVDLRSGRWWIAGESRSAADVRAEREAGRDAEKQQAAELAIGAAVAKAAQPIGREELVGIAATKKEVARAAIRALLARGEIVEVERRPVRARTWLIWTRELASAAGIPIVGEASYD